MHFGLLGSSPSLRRSRFTIGADAPLSPGGPATHRRSAPPPDRRCPTARRAARTRWALGGRQRQLRDVDGSVKLGNRRSSLRSILNVRTSVLCPQDRAEFLFTEQRQVQMSYANRACGTYIRHGSALQFLWCSKMTGRLAPAVEEGETSAWHSPSRSMTPGAESRQSRLGPTASHSTPSLMVPVCH